MTTYSEDFAGMTTGSAPTNFTARFTTSNQTDTVENPSDGEAEDDRAFRFVHTANAERLFSFDAVDSDTNREDSEILVRWRINDADADLGISFWVNGSGSAGSEDGYYVGYELVGSSERWQLKRYDAGTSTDIGTVVVWPDNDIRSAADQHPVIDKWYWCRFRKNGTALQFRVWSDGDEEPTDWLIDETDSDLDVDGWVGVGCGNQDQFEVDYVAVGTAGDTALADASTNTNVRLTAAYAAVLHQDDGTPVRLSAAYAAVLHQDDTTPVRLTAAYAAVLYAISAETPVDSDHVIPVEWQQGLAIDKQIPIEYASEDLQVDHAIPVEWKTDLLLDNQIPVEWINVTTPGDHLAPIEWRQGIAADNEIPVSWLQGIAADGSMPIIWSGPLSADSGIPVGWTLELDVDREVPIEWRGTITPHDSQIPIEWRGGVTSDHQPIFEWEGEVQPPPDFVIPFAWRGPFSDPGSDYEILFDWKLDLETDRQTPVEWTTELETDHQIPVEWLLESVLVSTHAIPINWAGFLDADAVIPIEWTTELETDHVIPYEWALTVFLEIDRQMPVEWKTDLVIDNGIPVEWFLQLELDHQIPVAWSGEFSAVDFIIPYEWTQGVALNASIPVEWNLDALQSFGVPIEWTVDVGDENSIPVEWLSPALASDHQIPIAWFSPVLFDSTIPFEWLQESFVATDHQILIEWQQIFFKQFNQIIPWEARGILDPTDGTMPIEWRVDPGVEARIPVEWVDPLFALFVTRDAEDCELWLADCNTAGWQALRCASLWLAAEIPHEAQSAEEPGGTWTAVNEEIGGTWFAQERRSNWEAPCLPTVWLSCPPDIWYADECPALWWAQEQQTQWAAAAHAASWIVLEPNVRGDR